MQALLEGILAGGHLPVQGGSQAKEDGGKGKETQGWGEEDRVSAQWVEGVLPPCPRASSPPPPTYPAGP
jgi:hypothetical protein